MSNFVDTKSQNGKWTSLCLHSNKSQREQCKMCVTRRSLLTISWSTFILSSIFAMGIYLVFSFKLLETWNTTIYLLLMQLCNSHGTAINEIMSLNLADSNTLTPSRNPSSTLPPKALSHEALNLSPEAIV